MNPELSSSPELLKGIDEFNQGQFLDCHETLEHMWSQQAEPQRQFTQGLIQIAVGCYHLLRGNREGATKLLSRGLKRIKPFAPQYLGFDVKTFMEETTILFTKAQDDMPIQSTDIPQIDRVQLGYSDGP